MNKKALATPNYVHLQDELKKSFIDYGDGSSETYGDLTSKHKNNLPIDQSFWDNHIDPLISRVEDWLKVQEKQYDNLDRNRIVIDLSRTPAMHSLREPQSHYQIRIAGRCIPCCLKMPKEGDYIFENVHECYGIVAPESKVEFQQYHSPKNNIFSIKECSEISLHADNCIHQDIALTATSKIEITALGKLCINADAPYVAIQSSTQNIENTFDLNPSRLSMGLIINTEHLILQNLTFDCEYPQSISSRNTETPLKIQLINIKCGIRLPKLHAVGELSSQSLFDRVDWGHVSEENRVYISDALKLDRLLAIAGLLDEAQKIKALICQAKIASPNTDKTHKFLYKFYGLTSNFGLSYTKPLGWLAVLGVMLFYVGFFWLDTNNPSCVDAVISLAFKSILGPLRIGFDLGNAFTFNYPLGLYIISWLGSAFATYLWFSAFMVINRHVRLPSVK